MTNEAVNYTVEDKIAIITIARPAERNAMNEAVVSGLENAWTHFLDSEERVAVLTGEGENFSVGLDLLNPPTDFWRSLPGIGFEIPKPIVAAVSGWCVGGAVTLVQVSDLCVAADNTKFLYPEVKVGMTGGVIAGLAARIPTKVALELMLLGEPLSAERAYQVGLVNQVVQKGQQLYAAKTMAHKIAGYAPLVTAALKRLVASAVPTSHTETAYRTSRLLSSLWKSEDFAEGIAAFREKRSPNFKGR